MHTFEIAILKWSFESAAVKMEWMHLEILILSCVLLPFSLSLFEFMKTGDGLQNYCLMANQL